jgi:hypothetical protein
MTCREGCSVHRVIPPAPAEPEVGTWVKDRFGAVHYRNQEGWAASPTGFHGFGKWEAMWEARGPLVECGPWGASLTDGNPGLWR